MTALLTEYQYPLHSVGRKEVTMNVISMISNLIRAICGDGCWEIYALSFFTLLYVAFNGLLQGLFRRKVLWLIHLIAIVIISTLSYISTANSFSFPKSLFEIILFGCICFLAARGFSYSIAELRNYIHKRRRLKSSQYTRSSIRSHTIDVVYSPYAGNFWRRFFSTW